MLQIQNALVSLDFAERYFCCDLNKCLGECCIEGDAGAPITKEEHEKLKEILPVVKPYLTTKALEAIEERGVAYVDEEGDLVTNIVDGRDCVFTCFEKNGMCLCAIEKAYREGKIKDFRKPASCYLYPARLSVYPTFTAVNFHRWKICKAAEILGRKENIRLYEFLKEPLTEYFGKEWYDELALACKTYIEEYSK
ncbi:MAG: DUF3109 family protein [Muribaculum sp.]|nr:DUF3109 family protein [Muribaculaceae bacterium]MCM1080978.1 DUF3109 family protein [Muribaculum sp.]